VVGGASAEVVVGAVGAVGAVVVVSGTEVVGGGSVVLGVVVAGASVVVVESAIVVDVVGGSVVGDSVVVVVDPGPVVVGVDRGGPDGGGVVGRTGPVVGPGRGGGGSANAGRLTDAGGSPEEPEGSDGSDPRRGSGTIVASAVAIASRERSQLTPSGAVPPLNHSSARMKSAQRSKSSVAVGR
jgi:hypothetical protein